MTRRHWIATAGALLAGLLLSIGCGAGPDPQAQFELRSIDLVHRGVDPDPAFCGDDCIEVEGAPQGDETFTLRARSAPDATVLLSDVISASILEIGSGGPYHVVVTPRPSAAADLPETLETGLAAVHLDGRWLATTSLRGPSKEFLIGSFDTLAEARSLADPLPVEPSFHPYDPDVERLRRYEPASDADRAHE